ncbi:MAG: hypothetical protein JNN15_21450 [Blastocatellia bacterium]|nr:hypothetical protein [Blastocatellia bacterium]
MIKTIPEAFISELNKIERHYISIGYCAICLFKKDQLEKGQIGYSVDAEGKSLVGTVDGDWQPNWLVIGYAESVGDPIFVDLAQLDIPVFTAMIGIGQWLPTKIADAFKELLAALDLVFEVSIGREYPVLLEQNPIPEKVFDQVIGEIEQRNPRSDSEFWRLLLGKY